MFSTPVFDAASISIMSKALPSLICLHNSQSPQGLTVGLLQDKQFNYFAKILALDVLPVPLGPLKR